MVASGRLLHFMELFSLGYDMQNVLPIQPPNKTQNLMLTCTIFMGGLTNRPPFLGRLRPTNR